MEVKIGFQDIGLNNCRCKGKFFVVLFRQKLKLNRNENYCKIIVETFKLLANMNP